MPRLCRVDVPSLYTAGEELRGCEEGADVRPLGEPKKTGLVQKVEEECEVWLDRFLHKTGAEAAGADLDAFRGAVDQRLDGLEIGIEDPLGLVVGVTDVIPGLTPLVADITRKSHG